MMHPESREPGTGMALAAGYREGGPARGRHEGNGPQREALRTARGHGRRGRPARACVKRRFLPLVAGVLSLGLVLSGCGGGTGPVAEGMGSGTGGGTGGMGTGGGSGEGGTGPGAADWLLAGTQASERARSDAIAALEALDARVTERHALAGSEKPLARIAALPLRDGRYAAAADSSDRWGVWSHPSMSAGIMKVQRVNERDGGNAAETGRQVVGIMAHGYFGVSHAAKRFKDGIVSNEGRGLVTAFHSFHAADDSISGALPLRSLGLDGARWTGDALGVARASGSAVFGSATLTVAAGPAPAGGGDHAIRLDVAWNDGDGLQLEGIAGGVDGDGGFSGSAATPAGDELWSLQGRFAGPGAEEALGAFRTVGYVGSFGAKREP